MPYGGDSASKICRSAAQRALKKFFSSATCICRLKMSVGAIKSAIIAAYVRGNCTRQRRAGIFPARLRSSDNVLKRGKQ